MTVTRISCKRLLLIITEWESFVYFFRVAKVYSMLPGKTHKFSPVEGQHVNVFLPGVDRILTLCEVEEYAASEGKTVTNVMFV